MVPVAEMEARIKFWQLPVLSQNGHVLYELCCKVYANTT